MKTCGIIAEYNPFHNGHLLQLNKAKAVTGAENIIIVMSGNFVQRGEPALCDKYIRTKMALLNGADIVIELPVYFATASAEYFASASVSLLDKSGVIDALCFGSESGEIESLSKITNILLDESEDFKLKLKNDLKKGLSFPTARSNAINSSIDVATNHLNEPNDILAIEYLKALKKANSKIQPFAIKRELAHYHSKDISSISSASAIRNAISNGDSFENAMPKINFDILQNEVLNKNLINNIDNFSQILHYILRSSQKEDLKTILDVTEGIENRILNMAGEFRSVSEILKHLKTKRYTFTKLQRALLHIILDIKLSDFERFMKTGVPPYIRILGFKKEKSYLLREMKKKSSLPIVLNLKNAKNLLNKNDLKILDHEIKSTDIYYLGLNHLKKIKHEYTIPICII